MLNNFIMFRLICRKGESWARDTCISLPMLFLKLQNKLASHCLYVKNNEQHICDTATNQSADKFRCVSLF